MGVRWPYWQPTTLPRRWRALRCAQSSMRSSPTHLGVPAQVSFPVFVYFGILIVLVCLQNLSQAPCKRLVRSANEFCTVKCCCALSQDSSGLHGNRSACQVPTKLVARSRAVLGPAALSDVAGSSLSGCLQATMPLPRTMTRWFGTHGASSIIRQVEIYYRILSHA